jgi:hypothetical protein
MRILSPCKLRQQKKLLETFGILKKRTWGGGVAFLGLAKRLSKRSDFHYKENPNLNSKRQWMICCWFCAWTGGGVGWGGVDGTRVYGCNSLNYSNGKKFFHLVTWLIIRQRGKKPTRNFCESWKRASGRVRQAKKSRLSLQGNPPTWTLRGIWMICWLYCSSHVRGLKGISL